MRFADAATITIASIGTMLDERLQAQIPCGYEVTHVIESPCTGSASMLPVAISPSGRYVCGFRFLCSSTTDRTWLYDTKTRELVTLPVPVDISTAVPSDVNEQYIVGQCSGAAGTLGYLYEIATGEYTLLSAQNADGTCSISAINSDNIVCGFRSIDDGGDPGHPWNAFVWSAQTGFNDLGLINDLQSTALDINDKGDVVGHTGNTPIGSNTRAFLYESDGKLTVFDPIPGGVTSVAVQINEEQEVIGSGRIVVDGITIFKPFSWKKGDFTLLTTLPDLDSGVTIGMCTSGIIAGTCRSPIISRLSRPCLWWEGAIFDLYEMVVQSPSVNVPLIKDIAENGQILLRGDNIHNEFTGLVISPIKPLVGDTNCDNAVDVDDLLSVINSWGKCAECPADLNEDSSVDSLDLVIVITNWTL